jgi:hypothetical protein
MPKEYKPIPAFENEDKERAFWAKHDSNDYIDWDHAETSSFSKLLLSTKTISLLKYFGTAMGFLFKYIFHFRL